MAGKIELGGSARSAPVGAAAVAEIDPAAPIVVTIHLKDPAAEQHETGSAEELAALAPVSREELAARRAARYAPAEAAIRQLAEEHGLIVRSVDLASRRVVVEGTAARMAEVFGAALKLYDDGRRRFRARSGTLVIPEAIAPWTRAILGFDHRPQVKHLLGGGAGQGTGLWPHEVARLYGFPAAEDGAGETIAIIALGGGYLASDLAAAAAASGRPLPQVVERSVGGAANSFGGGTLADQEIALDMQIVAGILPAARIVVYFADNTTQALADAISQVVFDTADAPQVLSLSWGGIEEFWTDPARNAVQAALADAVRTRLTVIAAAGDELATAGASDGEAHVWFPSSSPYVLACGGTAIALGLDGAIAAETVWNEGALGTGGGISTRFPVPAYQQGLALPPSANGGGPGRGVPDVAAAAAHRPGWRIVLNGQPVVKDGTSAVAPLWAALVALANARRGAPAGLLNLFAYANPTPLPPDHHRQQPRRRRRLRRRPGLERLHGTGCPEGGRHHRGARGGRVREGRLILPRCAGEDWISACPARAEAEEKLSRRSPRATLPLRSRGPAGRGGGCASGGVLRRRAARSREDGPNRARRRSRRGRADRAPR